MTKSILAVALLVVVAGVLYLTTRPNTAVVLNPGTTTQTAVEKSTQTQITSPTSAGGAQSPTVLALSNGGMTTVSPDIFTRTELTSLDLSHNQLSGALPGEVRHLSHLKTLDLSYNTFTGVPAEVGQLSELTSLNLSHNPITGLPLELGNLAHLTILNLVGTQYSKADLEQIRKKLPQTTVVITE